MISFVLFWSVACQQVDPTIQLVAHRGGVVEGGRIENNLPAMEEAVRRGYWMLEVDIRSAKDGHPVVHHDADFRRDYGQTQRVADLTWAEMQALRSHADGLRPLDFAQVAAFCRGKIRLMLDVKPQEADERFFRAIEGALVENDLFATTYLIGSEGAKRYFGDRLRVSVDGPSLRAAIERGEPVSQRYFVFGVAAQIGADTVRLAQEHDVDVVPAVNTFRYSDDDTHRQAADDVRRLRGLGVRRFQIDSAYEPLFTAED